MTKPSSVSSPAGHRRLSEEDSDDSRSSCSLGRDSDEEGGFDIEADGSGAKKKGSLNTVEDSLEEALPTKRGISMFYEGKSKSFTSLGDAISASSVKEFAKSESPFVPKRNPPRNPLARTSSDSLGARVSGIKTKTAHNCENSMLMQSSSCLPPMRPLPKKPPTSISRMRSLPQNFNCRSFSLADIRCMASASSND